ncbi:MAG: hypothetical protein AB9882_10345 [Ignavibacteriaceae bacterium]
MKTIILVLLLLTSCYSQTVQYQIIKNETSDCTIADIPNDLIIINYTDSTISFNQGDEMVTNKIKGWFGFGEYVNLYYIYKDTLNYVFEDSLDFKIGIDKFVNVAITENKQSDEGTITITSPAEAKCFLIRHFRPSEVIRI